MSEATLTASEMRVRLVKKASTDPEFRAQLISDPKSAIKDELEMAIPPNFTIEVHEDAGDTAHLVLAPPAELADAELATASGGQVFRWSDRWGGGYVGIDNAITFWDDFNGPTYHGGPKHNAD